MKSIFRYKADRLPIAIIFGLFLADLFVFFSIRSVWILLSWSICSLLWKMFIGAWNHHHQHVNTFYSPFLNRALEVVLTFHTGVSTNLWVLHHNLGHHLNYLDQSKDESRWQRADGTKMGRLEYTLKVALTGYPRGFKVGTNYPKHQSGLVGMGVINLLILGLMFTYSWKGALIVFALPMLISYLATCWTTYHHHAGLDSDDHFHASHNVTNKWHNIITGNLGYHTAHHYKQGVHWSELPKLHEKIKDKIPEELIAEYSPGIEGTFQRGFEMLAEPLLQLSTATWSKLRKERSTVST